VANVEQAVADMGGGIDWLRHLNSTLAVSINLVAFSVFLDNLVGQAFAMFVLTVAAAEAAIGLAILVVYFRNRGSIAVEDINMMKG
jgi:NADH-quinone oxidoreductase subunit K